MRQLEAPWIRAQALAPGSLGQVTNVRWRTAEDEKQNVGPHWAPGEVYVPFNADTTGGGAGTIPASKGWPWGFVLARRSTTSPWVIVDEGTD
jgi:hypothetical protein